jgi:hypothetical protein
MGRERVIAEIDKLDILDFLARHWKKGLVSITYGASVVEVVKVIDKVFEISLGIIVIERKTFFAVSKQLRDKTIRADLTKICSNEGSIV